MKQDAFTAGICPGGLTSHQEIKILICYLLYNTKLSLRKNDIASILQNYGLANYFESSQAFSEMLASNNIASNTEEEGGYHVTPSGKIIVEELSETLPLSVREKALKSVEEYMARLKRERENKVMIKKNPRGYDVICKISGGEFNMLELKIYAPNMMEATTIRDNFYKSPELLYRNIMTYLTKSDIE